MVIVTRHSLPETDTFRRRRRIGDRTRADGRPSRPAGRPCRGEAIVLYTDGVTDVPPPHELDARAFAVIVGEEAALADSAEGLADRLHDRLASILEVDQRSDDIALMILRGPARGLRMGLRGVDQTG